jgi:predicted transcriptional regulator
MPATTGVYPELVEEPALSLSKGLPHTWRVTIGHAGLNFRVHPLLTPPRTLSRLATVEVHLRPETESRLQELATKTGRAPGDLIEDAMAAYLQELAQVRDMLDGRYDDLKSGRVKPVDGEEAFANLRRKSKNDARRSRSRADLFSTHKRIPIWKKSGNTSLLIISTPPIVCVKKSTKRSNRSSHFPT